MSVKDTMNAWGREYLNEKVADGVPEGTDVTFEDMATAWSGCDTCGPDVEYVVDVSAFVDGKYYVREWSGKFGDLLAKIIAWEANR